MIDSQGVLLEPVVDGLLLFLELADILDGTLQDRTLILVAVWHKARDLVDAFVDGFTATSFNCDMSVSSREYSTVGYYKPSLWLFLRIWCHSGEPTVGFWFMLWASRAA